MLRLRLFVPLLLLAGHHAPVFAAAGETRPGIADLAWLEGAWEGEGIGGASATEVYSAPAGGQIVGHFRQLKPDGSVMFYELITIGMRGGVLTYALKHFNPDLTGWEERDTVRAFPLSAATDGKWEFSGLTYERTGPDSMAATVTVKQKDGSTQTLAFRFRRKAPQAGR